MPQVKEPIFSLSETDAFDAPVWTAETPLGAFSYGCDLDGVWWWQAPGENPRGVNVDSKVIAKHRARQAYFAAILAHPLAQFFA